MTHLLRHRFSQLLRCEQGSFIILFALTLLVLGLAAGFAIDVAREEALQSRMQAASDAGALATGQMVGTCFSGASASSQVTSAQIACMSANGFSAESSASGPRKESALCSAATSTYGCATSNTVTECMQAEMYMYYDANLPTGYMQSSGVCVTPTLNANGSVTLSSSTTQQLSFITPFLSSFGGAGTVGRVAATSTVGQASPGGACSTPQCIFVTDSTSGTVSIYDNTGKFQSKFALSNNTTGWITPDPGGIAIDASGNVWVARLGGTNGAGEGGIYEYKLNPTTGKYTAGPYFDMFYYGYNTALNLAIDSSTNDIFVTGALYDGVDGSFTEAIKYKMGGTLITQFDMTAGNTPYGVAIDSIGSNLWVTNPGVNNVESYSTSITATSPGACGPYIGPCDVPAAYPNNPTAAITHFKDYTCPNGITGSFSAPAGLAFDGQGNFWVADSGHYRLEKFNTSGACIAVIPGGPGSGDGEFGARSGGTGGPANIAIDINGNVWVTDPVNDRVEEFVQQSTSSYAYQTQIDHIGAAGYTDGTSYLSPAYPVGIAIGPSGATGTTITGPLYIIQ